MAEGRDRQLWLHTSWLLAMTANVHRDPRKCRAFRPSDFDPYAEKRHRGVPLRADNISILKALLPRTATKKEKSDGPATQVVRRS